jgi:hypothetical protein
MRRHAMADLLVELEDAYEPKRFGLDVEVSANGVKLFVYERLPGGNKGLKFWLTDETRAKLIDYLSCPLPHPYSPEEASNAVPF